MSEQGSSRTDRNRTSYPDGVEKHSSEMKKDVVEKYERERYEHQRKELRLIIARQALHWVFYIIAGTLIFAFVALFFLKIKEIFDSPVLSVVFSGLFGILTLILGFIAGSNISD